jgi:hypothetical protein
VGAAGAAVGALAYTVVTVPSQVQPPAEAKVRLQFSHFFFELDNSKLMGGICHVTITVSVCYSRPGPPPMVAGPGWLPGCRAPRHGGPSVAPVVFKLL